MTSSLGTSDRPDARRARVVVAAMMVALIALASGLMSATSAAAHGGPFELHVSSDAAGGIALYATYLEDGHIVTEVMDPVAMAMSAEGEMVGPIALISSAEGEGRWVSEEPFLDNGDWTVDVTTTEPGEAAATIEFTVEPLEAPIEPQPIEASTDASATPAADADGQDQNGSTGMSTLAIAALIAGAALIIAALVIFLRKRATPTS
ncbi:hypothetical protein [Demequina aurantiaca]|uniref:hypothetical protein n=1 Tax=Demequina aurantiaca TaxID=676200 RepID=UPI003D33CA20